MKKIALFALAVLTIAALQAQNRTCYYERTATVKGGSRTAASGDGHYLTFTGKEMYESNANGTMAQYAMQMPCIGTYNGISSYEGSGYLGTNLVYKVSSDLSRINVVLSDGTTLVYERRSKPTPTRMRGYNPNPSSDGGGGGYIPPTPNPNPTPNPTPTKDYYVTCSYCHGRRVVGEDRSVPGVPYSTPSNYVTCYGCGKSYDSNRTTHSDRTCPKCQGAGQTKVR